MSRYPDVEVEIFEAASEFSPIGAGIGIWPRAWRALMAIGLEDLAQYASRPPSDEPGNDLTGYFLLDSVRILIFSPVCTLELRKSDQFNGYSFCRIISDGTLLFFHRADFHAVLVKHLSCQIQYSKRLKTYRRLESGELELLFDDHSISRCDLLIGADGIKSAVRQTFLHEQAQKALAEGRTADADTLLAAVHPAWTGALAYRALVPVDKLDNYVIHDYGTEVRFEFKSPVLLQTYDDLSQYLGKDWVYEGGCFQAIIAYPIAKSSLINIVAYHINDSLAGTTFDRPWIQDAEKDDLLNATSHWEPEFIELTKDGCLLAELLGHRLAKRETLPTVLRIYDVFRRPFAQDIAQKSFKNGSYLTLTHEDFILDGCEASEEAERLHEMGEVIIDNWRWAWETSLDNMIHRAIFTFEEDF
ncbi:hypothetical protein C0993_005540 [Termitomyces sp. T159_Od127]|nr:hypothetical protein C0993_005540 [Termitomyces sp. T159_Od127]